MQGWRQDLRRDAVFLRVVEAAAVHGPQLAADSLANQSLIRRRQQVIVEPDEIERGADPGDAGDQVHPAAEHAQEFDRKGAHEVSGTAWSAVWRPEARRSLGLVALRGAGAAAAGTAWRVHLGPHARVRAARPPGRSLLQQLCRDRNGDGAG